MWTAVSERIHGSLTKRPGHEAGEGLANAPPSGEKRQDMLLIRRKILKKDSDIKYEVAAGTEGEQSGKRAEREIVWTVSMGVRRQTTRISGDEGQGGRTQLRPQARRSSR